MRVNFTNYPKPQGYLVKFTLSMAHGVILSEREVMQWLKKEKKEKEKGRTGFGDRGPLTF